MIPYYYGRDFEYANKRLGGTFVDTIHRKLFYLTEIADVLEGKTAKLSAIGTFISKEHGVAGEKVVIGVDELDMSPLPLGYVFSQRRQKPVFVSRMPMRNAYRQGLSMNTIEVSEGQRGDISATDLLMPVYNSYPTLKAAKAKAIKEGMGMPFSRQFAVTPDAHLVYRGRAVVGEVQGTDKPVAVLSPQFAFLQQHLDWVLK